MKHLTAAILLACAGAASAGEGLTVSGFASFIAGKAYNGTQGPSLLTPSNCPCFIGNYEHGSIYQDNEITFSRESLVGIQGKYSFSENLSGTVQAVLRPSGHDKPEIHWAYLSYDLSPKVTVQAGRRRLPIYAYSDSFYVGYTLPWVRVPQDVYGWEIGAYNGANISYTTNVGNWAVRGNLFAGQESTKNNIMERNLYYNYPVDVAWKHILGGYLDVSNNIFGARLVYMQNSIDITSHPPDEEPYLTLGKRQHIVGLAASVDYKNWMVRAEANTFWRPSVDFSEVSWTTTVGYRFGKFTALLGYSSYKEADSDYYWPQIENTRFAALRWDFRKDMDLKIQFDKMNDHSQSNFTGDAKVISVALDMIF